MVFDIVALVIIVLYILIRQILVCKTLTKIGYEWYIAFIPIYCEFMLTRITFGSGIFYWIEALPFVFAIEQKYVLYNLMREHNISRVACIISVLTFSLVGFAFTASIKYDYDGQREHCLYKLYNRFHRVRVKVK